MPTWTLAPATFGSGSLADFATGLIRTIGTPDFGASALAQLNEVLPFASWSIYRVGGRNPRMYLSGAHRVPDTTADCWQAYLSGLYRHDSTFRARRFGLAERPLILGHWRAEDISRPHREQIYERHGMRERVSLAQACGDGSVLAVNLYRHDHEGAVRAHELRELQSLGQILFTSVQRHLALWPQAEDTAAAPTATGQRQQLLRYRPDLTPRELDVCLRLVQGLTFDGIAADLGLSVTTIKTYRNRAFTRLGIQHRNQLYGLLLGTHLGTH